MEGVPNVAPEAEIARSPAEVLIGTAPEPIMTVMGLRSRNVHRVATAAILSALIVDYVLCAVLHHTGHLHAPGTVESEAHRGAHLEGRAHHHHCHDHDHHHGHGHRGGHDRGHEYADGFHPCGDANRDGRCPEHDDSGHCHDRHPAVWRSTGSQNDGTFTARPNATFAAQPPAQPTADDRRAGPRIPRRASRLATLTTVLLI